jgi:hypothetical protein
MSSNQQQNALRNGKKWSVNETLKLQREYELLELSIQDIASAHKRNVDAILFRLLKEGFINKFESARGYTPPQVRVKDTMSEFNNYLDSLLSENRMTIEEIQECVSEKACSLKQKKHSSTKPKRVLRQYKTK